MKSYTLPDERRYTSSNHSGNGGFWNGGEKPYRGSSSSGIITALNNGFGNGIHVNSHVIDRMVREWKDWMLAKPTFNGSFRHDNKYVIYDEGNHINVRFSKSVLTTGDDTIFIVKFGRSFRIYRNEVCPSGPMPKDLFERQYK